MRRVVLVFCAAVIGIYSLPAQENTHYFLDGFELSLTGDYEMYVISSDQGIEELVEIVTPENDTIYAIFTYNWKNIDYPIDEVEYRRLIVDAAYELYEADAPEGVEGEITIQEDLLFDGNPCKWVELWYGDTAYVMLAADVRESPGAALFALFCFPPFFGYEYEQQYTILDTLKEAASIQFFEAAG
jgi:hypothetical protein